MNRNHPRLLNFTKKRRLSNGTNIFLVYFFSMLLIIALFAPYISCNNIQRTEPSMKLGGQKHDTSNPFLRALLTNQQFTAHVHPHLGRNNEFMSRKMAISSQSHHIPPINQMMVNSNQMPILHIGHQNLAPNMGVSESSSYNSIASLQDYPERPQSGQNNEQNSNNNPDSNVGQNGPPTAAALPPSSSANIINDEPRSGLNEYQSDQNSFEHNASIRNSNQNGGNHNMNDQPTNSRSSGSDGYSRPEQIKPRDSSSNSHPLRSSLDPFEDIAGGGISTSEYERDLADLDEEFNRHTSYRRPTSGPIVSDSYLSLSPDRYEARRYNRRPSYDYTGDYLNTAGSISSIVPRAYQRSPPHWSSASPYSDNSDLWADSNVDFSPLSSYVSPSQYSYRWRPRYQRVSAYPYLTASASEQHLHPGYNMIPSYTPQVPTETISIALSPLAAAAAAAASALAAADKSRHQNHHHWLTLPRITTNSINPTPTTSTSAPNTHTQAIPAAAFQTAYIHRPNPYALSSMPIYAIAPRPTAPIAPPSHPSGAAASYIPYFHGGAPAIIAYRPTNVMPPASLLTAASFAYPLRLPVTTIPKAPTSIGMTINPTRSSAMRPFHSDLQYAESKSKTNLNNNTSEGKGLVKGGTLTAMAKNLTRKMFGSSSQIRPQHVAPPPNLNPSTYDLFSPTHNSSSSNAGSALSV